MRFEVLGPLRITADAEVTPDRSSHRRLLAILLFEASRPLDSDQLIDRHWGEEPPATAKAALQTYISQLRKSLGDGLIGTSGSGYQLDLRGHHLDRQLFEALASAAHTALDGTSWDEVVHNADRALELWRGTPFDELQDDEFARSEIVRLEEQRLELIEMRAEALLALGRNEEVLPDLERFVLDHPLRERLWEHLMVARARLGRVTEAIQAYQHLRSLLSEMGLEPSPALRDLEERILREDPVLVPGRVRHNLPRSLTTFVGRHLERTELDSLMDAQRLVTLTGVGGSGKTRLAVEIARERLPRYPEGVWMVDLAPLSDPDLVTSAVAVAIGLRAELESAHDAIVDALRHRRTLIVLDNCEHLLEGAATMAGSLLAAGPGVNVIATSREQLGVTGEAVYAVSPLDVPQEEQADAEELHSYASVQLFADRARLSANRFALTEGNAGAVAAICRRLDGLPLAIELAAARMRSLSPAHVADRLDEGLGLVSGAGRGVPPRQRAVEATIDWSYRLLAPAEQALFARLSVFAGGFATSSVEEICAGGSVTSADVVQLLSRLVDKSLVVPLERADGSARHRLLETLREYAAARLRESGDAVAVRRSHRDHFHRLARMLIDGDRAVALARLKPEPDNLETALDWSLEQGDAPEAADLATALAIYWLNLGHAQRATGRLTRTLEEQRTRHDSEHEALMRSWLASARFLAGEEDGALGEARRALALLDAAVPSATRVRALIAFSRYLMLVVHEDPRPAVDSAREAVEVARAIGDRHAEIVALSMLGEAEAWTGAADGGIARAREALTIADELEDPAIVLGVYASLLFITNLHGEARREEPRRLIDEVLSRFADDRGHLEEFLISDWVGYTYLQTGEWDRAEDFLEGATRQHLDVYQRVGVHHLRGSLRWMQGRLDEADADLGDFRRIKPVHRWYHDLLPLEAEVAADAGRLEQVRTTAAEYLAVEVHSSEEAMKAAVLRPLVAAEVDAALRSSGDEREDHGRRAGEAVARMRELIRLHPPLASGSVQYETAQTQLLLAEGELSRVSEPEPSRWRAVIDQATYAYWRLYARWRLAEALFQVGERDEGIDELRQARDAARAMGAERILSNLDALALKVGATSGGP